MSRFAAIPLSVLLGTAAALPVVRAEAPSDIYRSVLRIEAATQTPDYATPWNAGRFSGGIGTGFIIGHNRILTNAHVVSNARRLLINVHGSPKKYPAKVEYIAHDCDLALLSVADFQDFEEFPAFAFGEIPALESQVRVIGYPIGGERLSVTRGVVSRVDFQAYSHSRVDSHLVIQIDAAINPGNSGGPVVQDGKVIGVAFQGLRSADNTGYIIPVPVIKRFLKDVEDGTYDQYVELGVTEFPLFNPAMRAALGLPQDDTGVLVTKITPTSSADGILAQGDVILATDGRAVDSAGMIQIDGENVSFQEVIERKFAGDKLAVRYFRSGAVHEVEITLKPLHWGRIYAFDYESKPRYIVFAGLVLQPLDTNLYASTKLDDPHVRRQFAQYVSEGIFREREDLVVLTRVESDPVTSRLGDFAGFAVKTINGTAVKSLKHAYELLYPKDPPEFFVIELFGAERPVVIPAAAVGPANERVATSGGISSLHNLER